MLKTLGVLGLSILVLSLPASATPWESFGPRAMGMGGAGVALPQSGLSSYWNPASLGLDDAAWGLQLPVGAHVAIQGPVVQGANDLNQISQDCHNGGLGSGTCTQANINSALANLGAANSGVLADFGAGGNLKIKKLSFFVDNFTYAGAIPKVDNSAADTTAAAFAANKNQSRLTLRGISATEFGAGYGMELPFAKGVLVGGNLKLISARVAYYDYFLANNSNSSGSGSFKNFTSGAKESVNAGVDVGILWDLGKTFEVVPMHPRIGVTARDVNNPKFSQPAQALLAGEPGHYSLQGQSRLGVAISPFKFWNIAADADLTHNLTPVDGVVSQTVGLGTEVNVFDRTWLNIPLRAGVSKNIAMAGTKTAVSLGGGLNFLHVHFDAAAMASPSSQSIQTQGKSTKIPGELGASVQLAILFGGVN